MTRRDLFQMVAGAGAASVMPVPTAIANVGSIKGPQVNHDGSMHSYENAMSMLRVYDAQGALLFAAYKVKIDLAVTRVETVGSDGGWVKKKAFETYVTLSLGNLSCSCINILPYRVPVRFKFMHENWTAERFGYVRSVEYGRQAGQLKIVFDAVEAGRG